MADPLRPPFILTSPAGSWAALLLSLLPRSPQLSSVLLGPVLPRSAHRTASCSMVPTMRPRHHLLFSLRSGANYSFFLFPLLADSSTGPGDSPRGEEEAQDLLLYPSPHWVPSRVSARGVSASLPLGCTSSVAATGSPVWSDVSCFLWGPVKGRKGWQLGTPHF